MATFHFFHRSRKVHSLSHIPQMVWKSSDKMGCAIAKNGNTVYIVANYYPPGNFVGRYKANVYRKQA